MSAKTAIAIALLPYASPAAPLVGTSPGTGSLISWWKLEEAGGVRSDSHGTNNLTDNNTVGQGSGVQGSAADFVEANSEMLSIADNVSLSTGNIDFTVGGWINLDDKSSSHCLAAKGRNTVAGLEYILYYDAGLDRFRFSISDGFGIAGENADNFGSPSAGVWYHVAGWHVASTSELGIAVNGGTADTQTASRNPQDAGDGFAIGNIIAGSPIYLNGLVDEAFFYKKALTADNRTFLYQEGNGVTYGDL